MTMATGSAASPSPHNFVGLTADQAARRSQKAAVLAVILSSVAHGLVAWHVCNQPIGRIDLASLKPRAGVQRVRLVKQFYSQPAQFSNDRGVDDRAAQPEQLKALGAALLNPPSPSTTMIEPTALIPTHRSDVGPGNDLDNGDIALPETHMPKFLQGKLIGRLPLTVAFVPDINPSDASADLSQTAGPAADSSVQAARRLLADAGLQEVERLPPPVIHRPPLIESAVTDQRIVDTPLISPAIDFAGLALSGTTKLKVPLHLDNDFHDAISVYRPRKGPGFFRLDITGRDSLIKLRAMPKDVVLLIDTSGSVPQTWVNGVIRGVKDALTSLNRGDRFNIVLFKEAPSFFNAEQIQPYEPRTLTAAHDFLDGANSSGYTDVNDALSRLLVRDISDDRVYYLVLISDGRPTRGVMDTRELINRITRDNNLAASIYCVGVGTRQNQQLLDFLAYQNKGFSVFVRSSAKVASSIRDLISRLRYPILKDVRLDVIGVNKAEVFPHFLPNIHQGEWFQIFGRFEQDTMGPLTVRVRGSNQGQDFDFTFRRDLRLANRGPKQITHDWAFQKLHHLYSEMMRASDSGPVKKKIDMLKRRFKLKTLY